MRSVRPPRAGPLGLLFAAAVIAGPVPASARFPLREQLPWHLLAEPSGGAALAVEATRCDDARTGWLARGLRVSGYLPRGGGWLFLTLPLWSLDTAGARAVVRWSELAVPEEAQWPGESASSGAGNPEIGLLAPARLPLLGPAALALAGTLPLGRDALYPYGSSAMAVRAQVRRAFAPVPGTTCALVTGWVVALDSAHDRLQPDAYAGGLTAAAELELGRAGGRSLALSLVHERGGGAQTTLAGLVWTVPAGPGHSVVLGAWRSLGPADDRPFANRIGLAWRGRTDPPTPRTVAN